MQVISIIAESAPEAVSRIREKLGPDALVLNVRQLPSNGISRLWQKPRIEVLACVPPAQENQGLDELKREIAELKQQIPGPSEPSKYIASAAELEAPPAPTLAESPWRVLKLLERSGMNGLSIGKVADELRNRFGDQPPVTLHEEVDQTQRVLRELWNKPWQAKARRRAPVHVFVGPAGSGKTAVLCKWLTQSVLLGNKAAEVWRLDGATANTAESLSVYGEILGVPVNRLWSGPPESSTDIAFIDLPGVDWTDPEAVSAQREQIGKFPSAQVHLVLNACYEMPLLFSQLKAFSVLPVEGIIFSHLDEENRWGKVWNFVLGTNYSVRYLSSGQNVPGHFVEATPEIVFSRQFPSK